MIRFPAEWEPQAAVIIAWPDPDGDFIHFDAVEETYRFIATTISQSQPLLILCRHDAQRRQIGSQLAGCENIFYLTADYHDIWLRDTVFLTRESDGRGELLNFQFNGWGKKYPYEDDNALNRKLLRDGIFKGVDATEINFVLEGGSLESDGQGTLLSTADCLFNPNRNPGHTAEEISRRLKQYFGAERILWLHQPHLAGDDTDAHIDTLARFTSPGCIAYTCCLDNTDPHFSSLKHMEEQLQAFRTDSGLPYELIPLPLPQAIHGPIGQRLPANYANFLIINDAVMVPVYDDPVDQTAISRLADCFPNRRIIATPCRPLIEQYGSLHCMAMQFPATVDLNL